MQNKHQIKTIKLFSFIVLFFLQQVLFAQCAMCRAALSGSVNNDKAQAVNDGIVYLMAIPYILVAVLAYIIYKMKFKNSKSRSAV